MKYTEIAALYSTLIGAVLIASNEEYSKFGFIFFLIGNIFFIRIGRVAKLKSVVMTNILFIFVNLFAITQWFVTA